MAEQRQQKNDREILGIRGKLAHFQSLAPSIDLDRSVNYKTSKGGSLNYKYCTYGNLVTKTKKAMAESGIGFSHIIENTEAGLVLKTQIFEIDGDGVIESFLPVGNFNNPMDFGSRTTYAKRYSLAMLLGVSIDTDDEEKAADATIEKQGKKAPSRQKQKIEALTPAHISYIKGKLSAGMEAKKIIETWELTCILSEEVKNSINELEYIQDEIKAGEAQEKADS